MLESARIAASELAKRLPARVLFAVRKLAPEAVTAVDGAGARGHQQCTAVVLVQQALSGQGLEIAHRVRDVARRFEQFGVQRQHLPQQRIGRVAVAHARQVTAGHSQWKPCRRTTGRFDPFPAQAKAIRQLLGVADAVLQGLLPGGRAQMTEEGGCGYHVRLTIGSPPLSVPAAPGSTASA